MTFGMTLAEHLTMAASANMTFSAIDYENKPNMKVAVSNVNIKINQLFFKMVSAWPFHNGKPQGAWHKLALE